MDNNKHNSIVKSICENCEVKPDKEGFNFKSTILFTTGLIACPCHLPITIPLLITIFGGSVIASWISNNQVLIYIVSTVYFLLVLGYLILRNSKHN